MKIAALIILQITMGVLNEKSCKKIHINVNFFKF
jgi:hypothetical protein